MCKLQTTMTSIFLKVDGLVNGSKQVQVEMSRVLAGTRWSGWVELQNLFLSIYYKRINNN